MIVGGCKMLNLQQMARPVKHGISAAASNESNTRYVNLQQNNTTKK
jgi:hypothetical protein